MEGLLESLLGFPILPYTGIAYNELQTGVKIGIQNKIAFYKHLSQGLKCEGNVCQKKENGTIFGHPKCRIW